MFEASSMTLGPGVFVGLGLVAAIAEAAVWWAIVLAALLALLNSLTEVQVATQEPDKLLRQTVWLQFTCDWTLFLAQLTAAAIASLGIAGYLLNRLGYADPIWLIPTALGVVVLVAFAVLQQRTLLRWPRWPVMIATLALLTLIGAGFARLQIPGAENLIPLQFTHWPSVLQATALMVPVYARYEPLAIQCSSTEAKQTFSGMSLTIGLLALLCLGITLVGLNTIGAIALGTAVEAFAAPLIPVMQYLALPLGTGLLSLGAIVALLKMLITLLPQLADRLLKLNQLEQFGQSRSELSAATPAEPPERDFVLSASWAVKLVGIGLGCIVLIGNVGAIWSFSTAVFLMHYAVVHGLALARSPQQVYSRWLNGLGLGWCLLLAFQVEWEFWLVSLGLIALGLIWQGVARWSDEEE